MAGCHGEEASAMGLASPCFGPENRLGKGFSDQESENTAVGFQMKREGGGWRDGGLTAAGIGG